MSADQTQFFEAMAAEHEIRKIAHVLAHNVDRGNIEGMRACFFPDAIAEYGFNKTKTVDEFLEHFTIQRQKLTGVQHHMTTYIIKVEGDYAEAENYTLAHTYLEEDGELKTFVIGGRYLDKYERRDGVWKISHRLGLEDWSVKVPAPPKRGEGLVGNIPIGAIGEADPGFGFFKLIK